MLGVVGDALLGLGESCMELCSFSFLAGWSASSYSGSGYVYTKKARTACVCLRICVHACVAPRNENLRIFPVTPLWPSKLFYMIFILGGKLFYMIAKFANVSMLGESSNTSNNS